METKKIVKVSAVVLVGVLLGIAILLVAIRSMAPGRSLTQSSYDGTAGYLSAPGSSMADSVTQFKSVVNSIPQGGQSRSEVVTSEPPAAEAPLPSADRKIVKNGNLVLKVENVDRAGEEISNIAKQNGGQVFSSSINQTTKNVKSGYVMVKIPVVAFEKTFTDLKGIASFVVSESTSGQDVTEQYTDLQSQLKNKQAEEQAFQKILEQNAGKIDDILAVTREISRVRGEIERLQGRIKLMESQTDFSTIAVSISEEVTVGSESVSWRPWQIIKDELNSLLKDMQGFVGMLIYIVLRLIPMVAILTLFVWILWKMGKKIYGKLFGKYAGYGKK